MLTKPEDERRIALLHMVPGSEPTAPAIISVKFTPRMRTNPPAEFQGSRGTCADHRKNRRDCTTFRYGGKPKTVVRVSPMETGTRDGASADTLREEIPAISAEARTRKPMRSAAQVDRETWKGKNW